MPRRASDDPFFTTPNWDDPSQSIAAGMRRRSAASSRADRAQMKAEQDSVLGLRELFESKQRALDAAEARATAFEAHIAALEAQLGQLAKTLSSDAPSVTDVAVAGDDLLGDRDVREGRDDAAADSKGGDAADDAADDGPALYPGMYVDTPMNTQYRDDRPMTPTGLPLHETIQAVQSGLSQYHRSQMAMMPPAPR
jgi:hypothetical protein